MTRQATQAEKHHWHALLQRAITEPGRLMEGYRLFQDYSLGNKLFLMEQCIARGIPPGPTSTYQGWLQKGRHVKKGSKAFTLCMPVTITKKAEQDNTKEETRTIFIMRPYWFVLDQTEGEPYEHRLSTGTWDKNRAMKQLGITETSFYSPNGNTQGYAHGKNVAINPLAQLPHKTLFHELGHIILGHTEDGVQTDTETLSRSDKEVEAEGCAYLACAALGLPGAEYSRGYLQAWLQGDSLKERSAQRILSAADRILKAGCSQTKEARPRGEASTHDIGRD